VQVEDCEVVRVSGLVEFSDESSIATLRPPLNLASTPVPPWTSGEKERGAKAEPDEEASKALVRLPPLPAPLFIGDLRLAVLRQQLTLLRIPAAFAGEGILICGPVTPPRPARSGGGGVRDPRKAGAAKTEGGDDEVPADVSGGQVVVRKEASGRLVIEGGAGETFFAVRRAIYALHAAAG
jgi:cleavage and polyadenylation specificity factor subunit 2